MRLAAWPLQRCSGRQRAGQEAAGTGTGAQERLSHAKEHIHTLRPPHLQPHSVCPCMTSKGHCSGFPGNLGILKSQPQTQPNPNLPKVSVKTNPLSGCSERQPHTPAREEAPSFPFCLHFDKESQLVRTGALQEQGQVRGDPILALGTWLPPRTQKHGWEMLLSHLPLWGEPLQTPRRTTQQLQWRIWFWERVSTRGSGKIGREEGRAPTNAPVSPRECLLFSSQAPQHLQEPLQNGQLPEHGREEAALPPVAWERINLNLRRTQPLPASLTLSASLPIIPRRSKTKQKPKLRGRKGTAAEPSRAAHAAEQPCHRLRILCASWRRSSQPARD